MEHLLLCSCDSKKRKKSKKEARIKKMTTFVAMKKLIFILLLSATNLSVQGQVVSNLTNLESGEYVISSNHESGSTDGAIGTKILRYDDRRHILADMSLSFTANHRACFHLITKGQLTAQYVSVPQEYHVTDFSILGDMLYFCGYTSNSTGTVPDSIGFIAYFVISNAYNGALEWQCTPIPTTTVVRKIETYFQGTDNLPVVVGIGEQYYGKPPAWIEDDLYNQEPCCGGFPFGPMKTIPPGPPPTTGHWDYFDSFYYDCLIFYKPVEHYDATNNYVYNDVLLYRHKFDKADAMYRYEDFGDIAITDNYICLASAQEFNLPTSLTRVGTNFVLRRFNKNTFAQEVSNEQSPYGSGISSPAAFGLHLRTLRGDTIAFSYAVDAAINWTVVAPNIIGKVFIGVSPFLDIHTSVVGSQIKSIRKLEYFPESDEIVTSITPGTHFVPNQIHTDFHYIDMANTIFGLYPSNIFGINRQHATWDYILRCDDNYLAVVGNDADGIHIFEKATHRFNSNQCQLSINDLMLVEEIYPFTDFEYLLPCYYALLEFTNGEVSGGSAIPIYTYKARLNTTAPLELERSVINPICESQN
ncbi:MAG: hypothetical protein LBO06_03480 [Bacteroidales bacterium]|jgi:hypothetical protein|nr:hypothetical protein [Bacteroidales bacterium]